MYVSVGIFSEKLTRNEAANRCQEYGYDGLENGELGYIRYTGIVQKLQEVSSCVLPSNLCLFLNHCFSNNTSSSKIKTKNDERFMLFNAVI